MPTRPASSSGASTSVRGAELQRRSVAAAALCVLVLAYRLVVRPLLPPSCRFVPSCSEFALEALREHGAKRGAGLAIRRIARCHPWNPGGFDPVPARRR